MRKIKYLLFQTLIVLNLYACGSSGGGGGDGGVGSADPTSLPSSPTTVENVPAAPTGTTTPAKALALVFTYEQPATTTDTSMIWTVYAPEALTYTCTENNAPVSCTRVNSYTLESRYTTSVIGALTFKITITAADGRTNSLTKTITRSAPYVSGPSLTFTKGPVLPGLQSSASVLAYSFEVYSYTKALSSTGLVCKINTTIVACALSGSYTVTLSGTVANDGTYTASVLANSTDGGQTTITKTYTVDTTAPTISLLSAPTGSYIANANNNTCVVIQPSLPSSDTAGWRYKVNTGTWTTTTSTSVNICKPYGAYTVDAQAYDSAGNYSNSVTTTYTILNRYPSVTLSGVIVYQPVSSVGSYWITDIYPAMIYADAVSGCSGLNLGGYTGWSLPSDAVAVDFYSKGLGNFASNTNTSIWTSTDSAVFGSKITANLYTGVSGSLANGAGPSAYVRCVRPAP